MKTPLEFVRDKQLLQWNNGTRLQINGTFVNEGTLPAGSTWAMNPIPRINYDSTSDGEPKGFFGCTQNINGTPVGKACRQFRPPCSGDDGWTRTGYGAHDVSGECSGSWVDGQIIDQVRIPAHLAPGEYVLGWRWDCEESSQV